MTGHVEFRFSRYTSAELFRAACKRRGVTGKQRMEVVLIPNADVEHVWQLAKQYRVVTVGGMPA